MWSTIVNAAKSAQAFLSPNKVPPNTPVELQAAMRSENHLASKKFFVVFTSFVSLLFFYLASVGILFLLPTENAQVVSGYVTIFTKTIEIVAMIVASYLGVQAAVDLKYGSSSSVSYESLSSSQQIEENIIEQKTVEYARIYEDDPTYAPLEWVFKREI